MKKKVLESDDKTKSSKLNVYVFKQKAHNSQHISLTLKSSLIIFLSLQRI